MTRGSAKAFEEAMPRLIAIGWIEEIDAAAYITAIGKADNANPAASGESAEGQGGAGIPHQTAGSSHDGAGLVRLNMKGNGKENGNRSSAAAADLNAGDARRPEAATAATLGDLASPIRTEPVPIPGRTLADFQAVTPALLVTRDDRERAGTMLRLYGWDILAQAVATLAQARDKNPPNKRRVFVGEVADWLAAHAVLDPEDYDRAGIPRPQARA